MRSNSGPTGRAPRKASPATVDEYIAGAPERARIMLEQMRTAIQSAVPPGTEEVISYRIPAFKNKRVLVWYAAFFGHCSLFPTAAVLDQFKDELKGFRAAKGTVQFPLDKRLPTGLIRRMVKARVANA